MNRSLPDASGLGMTLLLRQPADYQPSPRSIEAMARHSAGQAVYIAFQKALYFLLCGFVFFVPSSILSRPSGRSFHRSDASRKVSRLTPAGWSHDLRLKYFNNSCCLTRKKIWDKRETAPDGAVSSLSQNSCLFYK
jgi:hypothetical protein